MPATAALPNVQKSRSSLEAGIFVPILVLLVLQAAPFFLLISSAFNEGSFEDRIPKTLGIGAFLRLTEHLDWISNTLIVSIGATALTMALGVSIAWIINRTAIPGKRLAELLIAIPYPLGPLVAALAWDLLGSPNSGLLNHAIRAITDSNVTILDSSSVFGIIFVMAIFETPVAVLLIGAAMRRMDPSLEECSLVFRASAFKTAMRITLPLMVPAILSTALFVFNAMLSSFAIPAILGARSSFYVATTAIFITFSRYPPDYALAAAVGLVLVSIAASTVWVARVLGAGRSHAVVSGKSFRSKLAPPDRWTPFLLAFVWLYIFVSLILPLGVLLLMSVQPNDAVSWRPIDWTIRNFRFVLIDFPTTRAAIVNSLILGIGTSVVGVLVGTLLALTMHRSRGRGRHVLEQLIMLPQSVPRLIFALGFLWFVLALPVRLYGSLLAVLLAYVLIFLPLSYRGMVGVIGQIDKSLEEAARMSGAGRFLLARTITFPLLRSGLLATGALLFMVAVQEVSASIFLSTARNPLLGPAILNFWDSGGLPRVSALTTVQAVIVLVALLLVQRFNKAD